MNRIHQSNPPRHVKVRLAQQKWQDAVTWREILVDDGPRYSTVFVDGWMDKDIKIKIQKDK